MWLVVFVTVLGALAYDRISLVGDLAEEIALHDEIAIAATEMHTQMLEARRDEKDFILRGGAVEYVQKNAAAVAAFHEAADHLLTVETGLASATAGQAETVANLPEARAAMTEYAASFAEVVRLSRARGYVEDGVMGELRERAREFEQVVSELGDMQLVVSILKIRRHEKDFLMRGDATHVERLRVGSRADQAKSVHIVQHHGPWQTRATSRALGRLHGQIRASGQYHGAD